MPAPAETPGFAADIGEIRVLLPQLQCFPRKCEQNTFPVRDVQDASRRPSDQSADGAANLAYTLIPTWSAQLFSSG